eukprot:scaffold17597_cov61-Phaeocystis_antarctica.AAC.5
MARGGARACGAGAAVRCSGPWAGLAARPRSWPRCVGPQVTCACGAVLARGAAGTAGVAAGVARGKRVAARIAARVAATTRRTVAAIVATAVA